MYLFHRPLLCEGIIYKHCLLALFSPFVVVPIVCDGGGGLILGPYFVVVFLVHFLV